MKVLKFSIITLFAIMGSLLVSCSGDDEPEPDDVANSDLTFNGKDYTFVAGIIEDFGSDGTHYNYDFTITDDELGLPANDYEPDAASIAVYVELFSAGTSAFQTGTFNFENYNGSYFDILEIFVFTEPGNYNNATYYEATSGSVTVTENSPLNYTLSYNVAVQEYNDNTGELVGTPQNVSFTTTLTFVMSQ